MRYLKEKGEVDYDFKHDILFFKTKEREYKKSIELDNIVIDVDSKGFIVGIQLFEASDFLNMKKINLRNVTDWEFNTRAEPIKLNGTEATKIEIRLSFKVKYRNKIIEKNPIIMPQPIKGHLPNSELACAT